MSVSQDDRESSGGAVNGTTDDRESREDAVVEGALVAMPAFELVRHDARWLERDKPRAMFGFAAGAGISIVTLFVINEAIRIVNPAIFGILLIGGSVMGLQVARLAERKRASQRARLHVLQQRYQRRLEALGQAIDAAQLSPEQVRRMVAEALVEYEDARARMPDEPK